MSIAAIRQGLATNLATIPEVQVSAYILSNPTPPTVWVMGATTDYDRTMGSRRTGNRYTDEYTATIQAIVSLNEDIGSQALLDNLLSPSGTYSVKAALEADPTLGGVCDSLWVSNASAPAVSTFLTSPLLLSEWSVTIYCTEVSL